MFFIALGLVYFFGSGTKLSFRVLNSFQNYISTNKKRRGRRFVVHTILHEERNAYGFHVSTHSTTQYTTHTTNEHTLNIILNIIYDSLAKRHLLKLFTILFNLCTK